MITFEGPAVGQESYTKDTTTADTIKGSHRVLGRPNQTLTCEERAVLRSGVLRRVGLIYRLDCDLHFASHFSAT